MSRAGCGRGLRDLEAGGLEFAQMEGSAGEDILEGGRRRGFGTGRHAIFAVVELEIESGGGVVRSHDFDGRAVQATTRLAWVGAAAGDEDQAVHRIACNHAVFRAMVDSARGDVRAVPGRSGLSLDAGKGAI